MVYNAVILAGGLGTRMRSSKPKVVHEVIGKSMVAHVVDHLEEAGVTENVAIIGYGREQVQAVLGDRVRYAVQEEQLGTGHAVRMASEYLKDVEGVTVVICGDTPLISPETIRSMIEHHENAQLSATVLTTELEDSTGYGRIIRDDAGHVLRIVEEKDASLEEKSVREINTGTYCFDTRLLFEALENVTNDNAQGEYYLTDVLEIIRTKGAHVGAYVTQDPEETLGVNDKVALAQAEMVLRQRFNEQRMREGVILESPQTTRIAKEAVIESDVYIEGNVKITGNTHIFEGARILSGSVLHNAIIGKNVVVDHSYVMDSSIGAASTIGPFAHIRMNSSVGEENRVGNYVELKNTVTGHATKMAHLTYIGDAVVGDRCNFGCGSITVNYDGQNKYKTTIGNDVFIGSNVNIIAPRTIEDGAVLAAGSTITKDVPSKSLAIARERQTIKDGWKK